MPAYVYEKLAERNIRLLELLPAEDPNLVSIKLTTHPIGNPKNYVALSYAWGGPTAGLIKSPVLYQGGGELGIGANLYSFLQRLPKHLEKPWPYIWTDAICINQDPNADEKVHQLPLMTEIYQNAQRVYVDLGKGESMYQGPDKGHLVFKLAEELYEVALHNFNELPAMMAETLSNLTGFAELGTTAENTRARFEAWESYADLMALDWFGCIWVIQEVCNSSEVKILYGDCLYPWEPLSCLSIELAKYNGFWTAVQKHQTPEYAVLSSAGAVNFLAMSMIRNSKLNSRSTMNLLQLVSRTTHAKATIAHDKIYGLLELAADGSSWKPGNLNGKDFPIDYNMSITDLYRRFAKLVVENYRDTALLYFAGRSTTSDDLPSWIPDWRRSVEWKRGPLGGFVNKEKGEPLYRTSGGKHAEWSISDDCNTLYISGFTLDRISDKGPILEFEEDHDYVKKGKAYARWDLASAAIARTTEIFTTEAYWRTIVANKTKLGEPVPESYGKMHEAIHQSAKHIMGLYLGSIPRSTPGPPEPTPEDWEFAWHVASSAGRRRFAVTKGGYMCLVPDDTENGDAICILFGSDVPFVLRKRPAGETILVGEAYVHGIMDGESLKRAKEVETFVIS